MPAKASRIVRILTGWCLTAIMRTLAILVFVGLAYLWLRRQRERHGWLTEPEVDVDLL